jgi:putative transposase
MGGHFMTLVRYVERNAQRAALVKRAEDWPWWSVYARLYGKEDRKKLLSPWPVEEPRDYLLWLNQSQPKEQIENIRDAIKRSRPYGSEGWVGKAAAQFGLQTTLRKRGRPGKGTRHLFRPIPSNISSTGLLLLWPVMLAPGM